MSRWVSLDGLFNEPRAAAKPSAFQRATADHLAAGYVDIPPDMGPLFGLPAPGVTSGDREPDEHVVRTDPESFQVGPPPGGGSRRPASYAGGRPLRHHVDAWLAAGGWAGRRARAGSIALDEPDTKDARRKVDDQWRYEVRCRGWEGTRWIYRKWVTDSAGVTRVYWWTRDTAPAVPPPEPER